MRTFYALNLASRQAVRMVAINNKFYEMTEGEIIDEVENIRNYVFFGEDGDMLQPKTIMPCFMDLRNDMCSVFIKRVDELVSRMKRWELRCDPDHDTCDIVITMIENSNDDWTLKISYLLDGDMFFEITAVSEEVGKNYARTIIEAAIALGVDIRSTWEFHRLENENENKKQDE